MIWTEAYGVCRAEQSYLVVINNTLEADYLSSLTNSVANKRAEGIYQRGIYHVGVHNRLNEGWQTVTGTSECVKALECFISPLIGSQST